MNLLREFQKDQSKYIFYVRINIKDEDSARLFVKSIEKFLPTISYTHNYDSRNALNRRERILRHIPVNKSITSGQLWAKVRNVGYSYKCLQRDLKILQIANKINIIIQRGNGGMTSLIHRL